MPDRVEYALEVMMGCVGEAGRGHGYMAQDDPNVRTLETLTQRK